MCIFVLFLFFIVSIVVVAVNNSKINSTFIMIFKNKRNTKKTIESSFITRMQKKKERREN
jgi:hypothetical protein